MKKRYDGEIERFCKFCAHGSTLSDPDRMLCQKNGIVDAGGCCRKFRYDPLKRIPAPSPLPKDTWVDPTELAMEDL